MGSDKSRLPVDGSGRFLVEVAFDALAQAGAAEVFVVGHGSDGRAGADFAERGLRVEADRYPGQGPLGGVITALRSAENDVVVALACDHTRARAVAIERLLGQLGNHDVVVARVEKRLQVMHAVWSRSALAAMQASFDSGERRLRGPLDQLDVLYLDDLDPHWFASANTPAEFRSEFGRDTQDVFTEQTPDRKL